MQAALRHPALHSSPLSTTWDDDSVWHNHIAYKIEMSRLATIMRYLPSEQYRCAYLDEKQLTCLSLFSCYSSLSTLCTADSLPLQHIHIPPPLTKPLDQTLDQLQASVFSRTPRRRHLGGARLTAMVEHPWHARMQGGQRYCYPPITPPAPPHQLQQHIILAHDLVLPQAP